MSHNVYWVKHLCLLCGDGTAERLFLWAQIGPQQGGCNWWSLLGGRPCQIISPPGNLALTVFDLLLSVSWCSIPKCKPSFQWLHISWAAKIFMILKDESETVNNGPLAHGRGDDISLTLLICTVSVSLDLKEKTCSICILCGTGRDFWGGILDDELSSFSFCYLRQYFYCHNLPGAPHTPAESLPCGFRGVALGFCLW